MIWELLVIGRSSLIKWMRYPKKVNKMERGENQSWKCDRWSPWSQGACSHTLLISPSTSYQGWQTNGMSLLRLGYIKLSVSPWALAISFLFSWITPGCHVVSTHMARPMWVSLEANPSVPVQPWDDCSPYWRLNHNHMRHPEPVPPSYTAPIPVSQKLGDNTFSSC